MQKRFNIKSIKQKEQWVGGLSLGLFGLLVACLLFPSSTSTYAETPETTANAPISVNVAKEASRISASMSGEVNLDVTPAYDGSFVSSATELNVSTNNNSGYKVYLSAAGDGNLVSATDTRTTVISPVSGTMDSNNFREHLNSWGYAALTDTEHGAATYSAVPSTVEQEVFSSENPGDASYNLGIASAIGADLPSGVYQGTLVVTVIANPAKMTLDSITSMQEMTSEICRNTPTPTTGTGVAVNSWKLTDTRDGKQYQVAKLKDGNCWMQENLALTLSGTTNEAGGTYATGTNGLLLTAENSDLGDVTKLGDTTYDGDYTWRPKNSTRTELSNNTDNNGTDSWILDTGNATIGTQWYYQWNTATAGTGQYVTEHGGLAPGSICPKGWKLPLAGDKSGSNNDKNGSFYKLLAAYSANGIVGADGKTISLAQPLNFVQAGFVANNSLTDVGALIRYASRVSWSDRYAYYLGFNNNDDNPWGGGSRFVSSSVRCVATSE